MTLETQETLKFPSSCSLQASCTRIFEYIVYRVFGEPSQLKTWNLGLPYAQLGLRKKFCYKFEQAWYSINFILKTKGNFLRQVLGRIGRQSQYYGYSIQLPVLKFIKLINVNNMIKKNVALYEREIFFFCFRVWNIPTARIKFKGFMLYLVFLLNIKRSQVKPSELLYDTTRVKAECSLVLLVR